MEDLIAPQEFYITKKETMSCFLMSHKVAHDLILEKEWQTAFLGLGHIGILKTCD